MVRPCLPAARDGTSRLSASRFLVHESPVYSTIISTPVYARVANACMHTGGKIIMGYTGDFHIKREAAKRKVASLAACKHDTLLRAAGSHF